MTDLKSQRRLAAQILKVGQNRVWINPESEVDQEAELADRELESLRRKRG
jgi:ribosomal protein L19E